jgi:hypothetical protein
MAIVIRKIAFSGAGIMSELDFVNGLNLVYGASNTGKSFATKAIDYMLGGSRLLPDISERRPYERAWLGLSTPDGDVMLSRALAGGNFAVRPGLTIPQDGAEDVRVLGAKHDHTDEANLSQFLLGQVGLRGKRVAVDTNGKKRSLSFRDISRFCIVDETTIQSEGSPIQTNSPLTQTAERSAFKLLLTGIDDSAIVEVVDSRSFKSSTSAQIEMLDDMLAAVDAEVKNGFADSEGLKEQNDCLEATFAAAQADLEAAQGSIRDLLERKRSLGLEVSMATARLDDIDLSLERFAQLASVYVSDIQRLEALDEAGFLLTLGGGRDCPLCGAAPANQHHHEEVGDVERVRAAAAAEAAKIVRQRADLASTMARLASDRQRLLDHLPTIQGSLQDTEAQLERLTPGATEARRAMSEIMEVRDQVRRGLALLDQRKSLLERRAEIAARKPAGKADRPRIGVDGPTVHEFSQVVSQVLTAWNFPGDRHVSFDDASYDLRIDGKLRGYNGKGVRAITHAAFKVALLIFCKERGLPHPGFLVLDTPLLTYRDPIGDDTLTNEERLLAASSLKQHFFTHLASLSDVGQFIVVENVDPPSDLASFANVVVFRGGSGGRSGLL